MKEETLCIFNYTDPTEYLMQVFRNKQQRNASFSLRAWAKQIGLRHHAMLSLIFSNKRRLKPAIATKIRKVLSLTELEARYFDILVMFKNAEGDDEKKFYADMLASIRPEKTFSEINLDIFRYISDWYHMAIIEIVNLKDFNSDPQWIASRLGDSVSVNEVKQAIDRLIRLGLLKRENQSLVVCDLFRMTGAQISNSAIQSFHAQSLDKAKKSLLADPIEERFFQSYTMAIDISKLKEAEQLFIEFEKKMADLLESQQGDEVYQFNMHLYPLTTKNKEVTYELH